MPVETIIPDPQPIAQITAEELHAFPPIEPDDAVMNNKELADALREVARLVEQLPYSPYADAKVSMSYYGEDAREKIAQFARILAPCTKEFGSSWASLDKHIGPVHLYAMTSRETVCKRIEVDEEVPEQIIPAREETVIPAHTQKVVKWDCGEGILAGEAVTP